MSEPLSELQECLVEQVRLTEVEKKRRVYYQNIVYSVCNSLDRIFAKRISRGEGVVCGTIDTPTTQVQDLMKEVEQRFTF